MDLAMHLLVYHEQRLWVVDILTSIHLGTMDGAEGATTGMGGDVSHTSDRQEDSNKTIVDFWEVRHCVS